MAITATPAASLAETVKNETKSPTTTTALTLKLLRALLGLDAPIEPAVNSISMATHDSTTSATGIKGGPMKSSSKNAKPAKSRVPAKVTIYTIPEACSSLSTSAQKLQLATETFNKTLKSLSYAAKARRSADEHSNNYPIPISSPPRLDPPGDGRPLHETSPNRQSKPPSIQKFKQKPPVHSALLDPGIATTAECVRAALDCLRRLEKTDNRAEDSQLDRGSLKLLENLNTLKLADLAMQEIHILKARLDHKIRTGIWSSTYSQAMIRRLPSRPSHALIQSLRFDAPPTSEALSNLVISFQKQVLKTIASSDLTADTDSLVEALQLGCKYGPCAIILQGYNSKFLSAETADLHLQTLAQAVSSLCSFACPARGQTASGALSPETAFQLQMIVLEIRCTAWSITKPQSDLERMVWAVFNRVVKKFCENSGIDKMEKYVVVKDGFTRLKSALNTTSPDATVYDDIEIPLFITEYLTQMAQDCGCYAESIEILQHSLRASKNTERLASVICRCNIATIRLQTFSDNPKAALTALEDALVSLKGSLRGSARELEDMLLHGVRLRKATFNTLWKLDKSINLVPLVDIQAKLRCCSIRVIFAILNFVFRYIGSPTDGAGASAEQTERFHQKLHLARSIAEITISNTLSAAMFAVDNFAVDWVETDLALNECLALARILQQPKEPATEPKKSQNISSVFLKVSNIYWSQFQRIRETTKDPAELPPLLKNSIQALEGRPEPEQRVGLLAAKYEKMASIYVDLREPDKAREALRCAIATHVSSSPFQDVIRNKTSHFRRCAWDSENSAVFALGKTLTAFVKLPFLSSETKLRDPEVYDDETLSSGERIALLERQFVIYMALNPTTYRLASIVPLAQLILPLYSPRQCLRRVQFLISSLKYAAIHQDEQLEDLLAKHLSDSMLADLENTLRTGPSFGSCGPFLLISLRLQWAFKKGRPSTQLLQDTIDEWSGLASEDQDWQISESHLDDPNFFFHQLQAVIDYTDMQGLSKLRLRALNLQHKLLESEKHNNPATLAMVLIRKGVQCNRLRFTDDAGRALASAKKCIDSLEPQPALSMEYHLALAEYLLSTSNLEGSLQALEVARSLYAAAFNFEIQNVHKRFDVFQAKTLCQSSALISRWEFKSGNLNKAVFHAKRCVKLSSQIWAGTQKVQTSSQLPTAMRTSDSTIDGLSHDLSNMNISNHAANERSATRGAAFWPYVSIHCGALMHLSYLLANCGLYQDGVYYAEQAQLIAQAVDSQISIFVANTLLLAHRRKGNDINADLETWNMKSPPPEADEASISIVSNFVYLAEASVSAGDMVAASEAIDEATKCLSRIVLGYKPVPALSTTEKDHNEQVVPFLKTPKPKSRTKITSKNTRKAVQANGTGLRGKERSLGVNGAVKGEDTLLITFARLETTIDVLKAHIMLNSGRGEEAVLLLSNSEDAQVPVSVLVRSRLIQARTIMDGIFKNLSADVVHSILAETTIAFPSLQKEHPFGKHAILESPLATKPYGRTHRSGAANHRKPMSHGTGFEKPSDLAIRAAELLLDVNIQQLGNCSTDMLRELSLMLNQCFMLSSVLMRQRNFTPVQVALQAVLPHCSAMARERTVIMTDVALTNESNITSWPEIAPADTRTALLTSADVSLIEPGLLDKLPEQWNIVSIRLSRTRDEFSITKFHVGQPPFSLRIPLRRSSPDNDGVDFGFSAAKMELLDIIKTANQTAHDARGQSDKEAKRSWWTEREALDDRLRLLLENIENIWLGGFRGILAHQHRYQDLLSRFSESFLQILNHHLPSRQKGRKATGASSNLHTHVLDLFVALGHPDEHELEDSIADLLYFVVDILQFQGEHNAYDEIDFDIVTVEVLDALRGYHEAIRARGVEHPQHTILILDKELLDFPWESLPCLDGRAVSRMPSLNCVESRLDKMRVQGVDGSAFSISTSRGAYILNPSSDLASTQSTFTTAFSTSLPNFSSIINRVPTEAEFESYLREKELFLYFGHGSGAQYIRGRNIKRLERCAVTFLMGCSSGKMVECGEFEPHGVPWNYMHANAPAVVGTLWDVTDKDIDRFAMKTFTEWGLLGGETGPEEAAGPKKRSKNVKGPGKSVKQPSQPSPDGASPEQKIALDEAVASARSSCVLRYLNGAAPVIYGIPIVLG